MEKPDEDESVAFHNVFLPVIKQSRLNISVTEATETKTRIEQYHFNEPRSAVTGITPAIPTDTADTLPDELFQNLTLRPVIKLQHHLLLAIFGKYLEEKSIKFTAMGVFQQRLTIENAVKRDLPLRHMLIGCIVGCFTMEEYSMFLANRVSINKRITSLIIQKFTHDLIKAA